MGSSKAIKPTLSSDIIHNRNCCAYLLELQAFVNDTLIQLLPQFKQIKGLSLIYDNKIAYGNLYSLAISNLEQIIEQSTHLSSEQNEALNQLIIAIYDNNNHILEQNHSGWINEVTAKGNPDKKIKELLKDPSKKINHTSPHNTESLLRRGYSVFAPNFKPQLGTNIPSIKNYTYKTAEESIEYRFSTQAQRHNGQVRISPLFERWLKIKAEKSDKPIVHIYFNNLGYHRKSHDIAGSKEKDFTNALHELERDPTLKIIVITLPADKGLMKKSSYQSIDDKLSYSSVFEDLLTLAQGHLPSNGVSDFRISYETRKLLFENRANEKEILTDLLTKSFSMHGVVPGSFLSTAQKQAIWIHFVKYELTDFIIKKISPLSYNFSCKDAIDRGAVSSAYYNLMKSFACQKPMLQEEFERALDAAAASVKGRGMNFHRKIIWNAIDSYVNANYEELQSDKDKVWLIYWRDKNCPTPRIKHLLKLRYSQIFEQLNALSDEAAIKLPGINLLKAIKEMSQSPGAHSFLLMKVLSYTSELFAHPSNELKYKYQHLSTELKIKHPLLKIIGGIMEIILGALFYIPSCGYSKKSIDRGLMNATSGFFSTKYSTISEQISDLTFSPRISK